MSHDTKNEYGHMFDKVVESLKQLCDEHNQDPKRVAPMVAEEVERRNEKAQQK